MNLGSTLWSGLMSAHVRSYGIQLQEANYLMESYLRTSVQSVRPLLVTKMELQKYWKILGIQMRRQEDLDRHGSEKLTLSIIQMVFQKMYFKNLELLVAGLLQQKKVVEMTIASKVIHSLIRFHERPRTTLFSPQEAKRDLTIPLERLKPDRLTTAKFKDGLQVEYKDQWTLHPSGKKIRLAEVDKRAKTDERWTGWTEFALEPLSGEGQEHPVDRTRRTEDFWEKRGHSWIRHHVVLRTALYEPGVEPHGPSGDELENTRKTVVTYENGVSETLEDDWRKIGKKELSRLWKGYTSFNGKLDHYYTEATSEAKRAKGLRQVKAPTELERREHELTHLPFPTLVQDMPQNSSWR